MYSASGFVSFRDLMHFELGGMQGMSGVEGRTSTQQTDGARFFGE